jgi:cobalamin biosynthesis protein CbiG
MKTLSVGIGCRLHSSADDIEAAVREALGSHAFDTIGAVASIDTKANERGLLEFCARHALPLQLFSREQIAAMPVENPSASTNKLLGVDGVCEPCALLAAADAHATSAASAANATQLTPQALVSPRCRLLVPKTIHAGVTVAIASTTTGNAPAPTHNDSQQQDRP